MGGLKDVLELQLHLRSGKNSYHPQIDWAGYRKLCKARVCWSVDKARDYAVRPLNLALGLKY